MILLVLAPWIPIALEGLKYVGENVLSGINNRKARLYNSPAEQVKRLQQAGLPQAAGSSIGGGTTVGTEVKQGPGVQDTIAKGVSTEQARISKNILQQQLREATVRADLAEDERNNKLNPSGVFTGTNQGVSIREEQQASILANAGQRVLNEFMPKEKGLDLILKGVQASKTQKDIEALDVTMRKMNEEIKNITTQGKITSILANYQERMSKAELNNLIARTTGIRTENDIKKIAFNVEYQTQLAKIAIAKNQAALSHETLNAARLGNLLTNLSLPSTQAYYRIRYGMDQATLEKPNMMNTLLYLGMFQPNTSNYNISSLMGSLPNVNFNSQSHHYIQPK